MGPSAVLGVPARALSASCKTGGAASAASPASSASPASGASANASSEMCIRDRAYTEGDIHIHDFDFYALTTTCTQIDLLRLFKGGFSTGHGYLREPQSIGSYAALAAIAIQSNQNDQHGGQGCLLYTSRCV